MNPLKFWVLLLLSLYDANLVLTSFNIDNFGAKPDDASFETAKLNGKAFNDAVTAANASTSDQRIVVVSRGKNYTILPYGNIDNIYNITIQFDGIFNAWHENLAMWPVGPNGMGLTLISFTNTFGLTMTGSGLIEGNGFHWWWIVWVTGVDIRPDLLDITTCKDTLIEGITFQNAPMYHISLLDAVNMIVQNLTILVNVSEAPFPYAVPTFPLNTDGIDISGRNVIIRNLTVINYDDAVAVKPIHRGEYASGYSNCTENIIIEDCYVKLGVGMSIGSVPPDPNLACIRNVTIRNIRFDEPFKAIYIKPNPGDDGYGLIEQILYENIVIYDATWWAIYIGTQQEHQPHDTGTGCSFFYPLPGQKCPTNPHVTVRDITLRNVTIHGGLLSPGILICNETNPCTNMIFDNVNVYNMSVWPNKDGYLCENFHGYAVNSNLVPSCFKNSDKAIPQIGLSNHSIALNKLKNENERHQNKKK